MPTHSFNPFTPHLAGADAQFEGANAKHARRLEDLMADPAYLDQHHPKHWQVKADVQSISEHLYGEKPVPGGQPFSVQSIPTIGTGQQEADEHMVADHRPMP